MKYHYTKGRECPNCGEPLKPEINWHCKNCGFIKIGKGNKKDIPRTGLVGLGRG